MNSTKHIFLIDPLSQLNLKKDSSLLWALTLKQLKKSVFILFSHDLCFQNDQSNSKLFLHEIDGSILDTFYLSDLKVGQANSLSLSPGDTIYMRMDPPMNDHYLNALMILREWKRQGIHISNDGDGILKHQEKLTSYRQYPQALPSFVGGVGGALKQFIQSQNQIGVEDFIIKPLNAYSGIGVEKISYQKLNEKLNSATPTFPFSYLVCQPFWSDIHQGEYRAIFWKQQYLGSILKKPKSGEYMANIAQGATFVATEIPKSTLDLCKKINLELANDGIDLVAYDIMQDKISEVNVTCPGLLVELSHAHQRNFAEMLF
ncbi:MAG: hypothetical protein QE271_05275 [Bacteriovoracaceae bacterium]|nr:hypothetical protein [Bacteriovoracaceae bacterium]